MAPKKTAKKTAKKSAKARKPAARAKRAPVVDRDGRQLMVPGVKPATVAELPDDDERTVQTITMSKRKMRMQRMAATAAGFKAWTHWALAQLDTAAGTAGLL